MTKRIANSSFGFIIHSLATRGSSCVARRAGRYHASRVIIISTPTQKPYATLLFQKPLWRSFQRCPVLLAGIDCFRPEGFIIRQPAPRSGGSSRASTPPGWAASSRACHCNFGQVVKRVGATQFVRVNETHEEVAYLLTCQGGTL